MTNHSNLNNLSPASISSFHTIAVLNEAHQVYIVQQAETGRIFVKKILEVYNLKVYESLYRHPIPGTPRIIAMNEGNGRLTLIEEYLSGTPLSERIEAHDLDEAEIRGYMLNLLEILEHLRAFHPPIIHRDIKPSNIIISDYGMAMLLDFNAAKEFRDGEEKDTMLIGTQGYAAPEQYGFGSSSPQTDLYSLGIVLKEMLTSAGNKNSGLWQIAEKCTQLEPSERYSSIRKLKQEIRGLSETPSSFRPSPKVPLLPPGFRSRTPWKMFLSLTVYTCLCWLCLSLNLETTTTVSLWIERIFVLLILLSLIFGSFNYLGIQRCVPLCQSQNPFIKVIGVLLLNAGLFFFLMFVMIILTSLAEGSL